MRVVMILSKRVYRGLRDKLMQEELNVRRSRNGSAAIYLPVSEPTDFGDRTVKSVTIPHVLPQDGLTLIEAYESLDRVTGWIICGKDGERLRAIHTVSKPTHNMPPSMEAVFREQHLAAITANRDEQVVHIRGYSLHQLGLGLLFVKYRLWTGSYADAQTLTGEFAIYQEATNAVLKKASGETSGPLYYL